VDVFQLGLYVGLPLSSCFEPSCITWCCTTHHRVKPLSKRHTVDQHDTLHGYSIHQRQVTVNAV